MNKGIIKRFGIGVGLLMFLLLPFKNIFASYCYTYNDNLSYLLLIVMIALASIIFSLILAEGKDLLSKVLIFCVFLSVSFFLVYNYGFVLIYFYVIFLIITLLKFKNKKNSFIKIYTFVFIALFLLFTTTFYEYETKNFYAKVKCKIFEGELKYGDCNLYCEISEK